ncbi:hypothetical protein Pelo_4997 [Pelomyxa schiedti]|nr:hypothetical protein Pelo_4997 [Pelomyxa schiedti]
MQKMWLELRGLLGDDGGWVLVEALSWTGPSTCTHCHCIVDLDSVSSSLSCGIKQRALTKWILGQPSSVQMAVWRVSSCCCCGRGSDRGVEVSEERVIKVDDSMELMEMQFSPVCDDVAIACRFNAALRESIGIVEFIDLESSFIGENLVVNSRVECGSFLPRGILWMPDGSTSTLHSGSSSEVVMRESTTGNVVTVSPESKDVEPIGARHLFVLIGTSFQVYSTNNLGTPSVCVPCTWASAHGQSGLIAYTSDECGKKTSELHFRVHDGATDFCVGDFTFTSTDPFVVHPATFTYHYSPQHS